ncbi:MAG: NTP transferase domain-containing protein [Gemmatimonadetes bacterium]|nr:NTP transferase domain-containing protein [Gemmatimonadota bacterium]
MTATAPRATTAVILARGLGTRMQAEDGAALDAAQAAAAAAGAKGLIPVAGHPLLDHVLDALAEGGVTDVVFVVAPGEGAIRRRYTVEAPPTRVRVTFAEQAEPRGTADALHAAEAAVQAVAPRDAQGRAHFLMCNADNLYPVESVRALVALDGPGLIAYEAAALVAQGNIPEDRVRAFALLDVSPEGVLREIAEKPPAGHPLLRAAEKLVSMNLWRFTSEIFAACAAVRPSVRGELELVDAVRRAMKRGVRFTAVRQRLGVLDLSRRGDVAAVERVLAGRVPRP